jgi:hypothetical protein
LTAADVSSKELMNCPGNAETRPALPGRHISEDQDRLIAEVLSEYDRTSQLRPLGTHPVPGTRAQMKATARCIAGGSDGRAMEAPGRGTEAPKRASDLERTTGFEPATPTLARLCSTS